jgi:hypothetical protein
MTACLADTERYPATAPQDGTGSAIRPTTDHLREVFLQNQALIEDVIHGVTRRGLDQRALYRRINRLLRQLRIELEAQGIDRTDLASWAAEPGAGSHQSASL